MPTGGLAIEVTWHIPGKLAIVAPRYSLARFGSSYEDAWRWVPERWATRPGMVGDARVFAPFSSGYFNCVGKPLAMSEIRFVVALLVKKFHVEFWEGGGNQGERQFAALKDRFTAAPGKLELRF